MLTKAQKNLKILMQAWMIILLGAGVIFLSQGNQLLIKMNSLSAGYTPNLPLLPIPVEKFWLTLTISLMTVLIAIAYLSQKDIRRSKSLIELFLLSKFVSTLFFVIFFITDTRAFAYVIGVLSDGLMFLTTYWFYQAVKKEMA